MASGGLFCTLDNQSCIYWTKEGRRDACFEAVGTAV